MFVIGGSLLVTGSCVGVGMLGLPIMTGASGFYPSLIAFFAVWLFMMLTGLLLVETNGWFSKKVNLLSMVEHTLGKVGKTACWILYLFLFYTILLAYIAGIGMIVTKMMDQYFHIAFPNWAGSLLFVLLFGWIVFLGTRTVDLCNRLLMMGKIAVFLGLVFLGARFVQPTLLAHFEPKYALFSLPIMVISFGFHNMVPSLANYMSGKTKLIRQSIIFGSLFALFIYLVWQILVLGIVPISGENGILANMKAGAEASQALMGILGKSWVSYFATLLAFFAILTSFLAQALSLSHFLADGFKISYKKHEEFWLVVFTLVPPMIAAFLYPNIFLKALNFAGGICTVVLFGIMPVLMVWKGRYHKKIHASYRVFGGKTVLVALFLFSLFVAFFQLAQMFDAPFIPKL